MSFLKHYFQLNKREERGIYLLILLIILVSLLRYFAPIIISGSNQNNNQKLVFTNVLMENIKKKPPLKNTEKYEKIYEKLNIHQKFNPNSITKEALIEMKLPDFVAKNWDNYRNAGAKFRNEADILKVYGMDSNYYNQIKDYLVFPKPPQTTNKDIAKVAQKKEKEEVIMEFKEVISVGLNTADSMELLKVNGIGPFYAGAIIKYRERLGGFIDMQQLMELYKMDSIKYQNMTSQLYLDSIPLQTISINQDSFKRILQHPYIDYKTTKYIVNKRQRLGKYSALYQLIDSINLPPEKYHQILPYLRLD